jgi:hypothetical protein
MLRYFAFSTYLLRDYELIVPKTLAPFNPNASDMRRILHLIDSFVEERLRVEVISSYIIDGFFWGNAKVKSASAQSRKKKKSRGRTGAKRMCKLKSYVKWPNCL